MSASLTSTARKQESVASAAVVRQGSDDPLPGRPVWGATARCSNKVLTLGGSLGDLPQLTFLFPGRLKDEAFRRYYSAPPGQLIQTTQDYIRTSIAATVLMDNLR